ncbi:cupin domain-containing protein [Variovorax sp. WS11]|uniref:cupin domain-containing protein n=1 Tax=Variovorax sp. WS11 TaxID=1105204 RepID=UPI000D0D4D98|nr:cupin domain-containing protein [Variovorax sp. WS11]NDZ18752.1 cupin domain-containing protein [Variovorax sp. WS11]PSL82531.1 cupin domain-containing protein [Variovorax sp. WS11]
MTTAKYFVRQSEVQGTTPEKHAGTVNLRLITTETVGAQGLEVALGIVAGPHGGGSLPHRHAAIEQANYILEGRASAEVGGQVQELGPGDMCYFPPDVDHSMTRIGSEPLKVLVIYSRVAK